MKRRKIEYATQNKVVSVEVFKKRHVALQIKKNKEAAERGELATISLKALFFIAANSPKD